MTKPDVLPKQEPHLYTSPFEAPENFRTLDGGQLSLDQINKIVEYSYDAQTLSTMDDGTPIAWNPQRGDGIAKFRSENKLVNDQWVPMTEDEKKGSTPQPATAEAPVAAANVEESN